jgi:multicomponent K+:H+ antiporter subunit F
MSAMILTWSLGVAQALLALAMICAAIRILRGPRAQDRVVGVDALSVNAMLLVLTFGIRTGTNLYFEAALVIAMLSFVGTLALAKFLMRGEVIE